MVTRVASSGKFLYKDIFYLFIDKGEVLRSKDVVLVIGLLLTRVGCCSAQRISYQWDQKSLEEAGTNYNMTAEESRALVEKRIEDSSEEFSSYSLEDSQEYYDLLFANLEVASKERSRGSFVRVLVNAMTLIALHKAVKRQEKVSHGLTLDREGMGAFVSLEFKPKE